MREQHLDHWFYNKLAELLPNLSTIKTSELLPTVEAFANNAKQATNLSLFPVMMYTLGARFKLAELAACMMKFDDPFADAWEDGV